MIGPALQRATAFVEIERLIVNTGYTVPEPAGVAQHGLDDMRRNGKALMQRRAKTSSKIVRRPFERLAVKCLGDASVEVELAFRPVLKPPLTAECHGARARPCRQDG